MQIIHYNTFIYNYKILYIKNIKYSKDANVKTYGKKKLYLFSKYQDTLWF